VPCPLPNGLARSPAAPMPVSHEGNVTVHTLKNWLPVFVAVISAIGVLVGYGFQKNLEWNVEIRTTRQEIYSRLIANITERNMLLGRLEQSPELLKADARQRPQLEMQMQLKNVELARNEGRRTEVIASLCLYGTDEAIDAYAKYAEAELNNTGEGGNLGELITVLRRSIYKTSRISADEANLSIWRNPKYLGKSSSAK
jgi:hypothetical protein